MNSLKMMFFAVVVFPLTVQSSASSSMSVSVPSRIVNDVAKVHVNDVILLHD